MTWTTSGPRKACQGYVVMHTQTNTHARTMPYMHMHVCKASHCTNFPVKSLGCSDSSCFSLNGSGSIQLQPKQLVRLCAQSIAQWWIRFRSISLEIFCNVCGGSRMFHGFEVGGFSSFDQRSAIFKQTPQGSW